VKLVNEDYREQVLATKARVEMVWGARDSAAPLAMAQEASELFSNAVLVVSESSGHLLDPALHALLRERLS
jgi:pimeloyl-ACP methyl ester carboxylesterase